MQNYISGERESDTSMEFSLVRSQKLQFLGYTQDDFYTNWITRSAENHTIAELTPVVKNYATEALTERLHKMLFKPKDNDKMYA